MLTRLLLAGLILLSLSACGPLTGKVKTPPPSTDLQILNLGVQALTTPRTVAGPIQRRSQAATNGELWQLSGNQSDTIELSEGDKLRVRNFVSEAVAAIELGRMPECGWLGFACRKQRRALEAKRNPAD